jgi:type VI secretion system ImpC/EvpB family protein
MNQQSAYSQGPVETLTREAFPPGEASPLQEERPGPDRSLLDAVLALTEPESARGRELDRFLREPSPWKALAHWLGPHFSPDPGWRDRLVQRLSQDIARLDELLNRQVNAILHHPRFQQLEAAWRGLYYLICQVPEGENLEVRMLNLSWQELARDQERALEFDQSQLFRKVYGDEFGMPGGKPFGVLLADYSIHLRPGPGHPTDDVAGLEKVAGVAAAAFAPFVAAAHPSLLDMDRFARLERPLNLHATFQQPEYLKWRAFRRTEDARFVGLTLPRVLLRRPWPDDTSRADGFRLREDSGKDGDGHLWGNAIWAFGAVLIRAFATSGWLGAIRGVRPGMDEGGLVTGLPIDWFGTDRRGVAPRAPTEVAITDTQDKELSDLGFLPLCWCQDSDRAAFYSSQSVQEPKIYDEQPATVNARVSAMLPHILCVSRFAHYLKAIVRDKVGGFTTPEACQDLLRNWLLKYVNAGENATPELRARYPLREARVRVSEAPGQPGSFLCVVHLRPQFQLDQLVASVKLVTRLTSPRSG